MAIKRSNKIPVRPQSTRALHQQKAFRNIVGRGVPGPNEGSEGDLTLRITKQGLRLFAKFKNKWYSFDTLAAQPGGVDGGAVEIPDRPGPAKPLPHVDGRGNFMLERGTKSTFSSGSTRTNKSDLFQDGKNFRIQPKSADSLAGASVDVVAGDFKVRFDGSLNRTYDTTCFQAGANAGGVRISTTSDFANDYLLLTHQAITQNNNGTADLTITGDRKVLLTGGSGGYVMVKDDFYVADASGNDIALFTSPASGGTAGNANFYLYDETKSTSTSYLKMAVDSDGATTMSTVDDDGTVAHLTLDIAGDIELNADGGDISFKDASDDLAALSSSGLTINNISEVGSDTDKFIMSDSGVLKYVTGANLRSYIGAGTGNGDMTGVDLTGGTGISIDSETNTTSGDYSATITCNIEGTEVVSTGETGAVKFLREDGDNTSSWQAPTSFFSWGATMRLIGVVAGDHVAVPTQYDGTTVELGTGTDPDAVYTVSTTGDHINMRMVQFPQNIRIKSVIASYAQGGSTNTTHNLHLMRYDVDADGDLTNGVVAASVTNFNSDDYSQRRNSSMTIDTDNDEITTDQCLIGVIEMMTAVNTYISCKFTIEIERY